MQRGEVARAWERNAPAWTEGARRGLDVDRDALNTPAFLLMLPDVSGLDGLDIGCGEGDALALAFPDAEFDFATAFMSLMDVPDPALALREAARVLKRGGFIQFSVLHPCFVPPHRVPTGMRAPGQAGKGSPHGALISVGALPRAARAGRERARGRGRPLLRPRGRRRGRVVVHGAAEGRARRRGTLPRAALPPHLGDGVGTVVGAGLAVEAVGEPCPGEDLARAVPIVADAAVAPLFLHVRARKPAGWASARL